MNVVAVNGASGNAKLNRRRWWLLLPVFLLNLLSAFAFNKFMGEAAYYSARIPITNITTPEEATQIAHAHQRADRFFLLFIVLIFLATVLMEPIIQLSGISSKRFRLPGRYVLVLVLCILAAGAVVHVFFLYSVAVAALLALLATTVIQDRIGPKRFRLVVCYLLALIMCVLTTGALIWAMAITMP